MKITMTPLPCGQPTSIAVATIRQLSASLTLALLCILPVVTGCQSGGEPGTMSHATVQIKDKPLEEIQQVARTVFAEDGYTAKVVQPNLMVFDRLGSRRDAIKWGGALTGEGVTMRVKVQIRSLDSSTTLLQADAYAVQDAGDTFFEDESRNVILNRTPYQKMLNEIKKRLK